jgi:hypothetical protein
MRGKPERVKPSEAAMKRSAATKLWDVSESLTGVRFS